MFILGMSAPLSSGKTPGFGLSRARFASRAAGGLPRGFAGDVTRRLAPRKIYLKKSSELLDKISGRTYSMRVRTGTHDYMKKTVLLAGVLVMGLFSPQPAEANSLDPVLPAENSLPPSDN